MTKTKPSHILLLLLLVTLCLSMEVVLTPLLSSHVRAANASQTTRGIPVIDILSPAGQAPVTVIPGAYIDVSAEITIADTADYIVTTTIVDSAADPQVVIGRYTQHVLLSSGNHNITHKISIPTDTVGNAAAGDMYDVIVTAAIIMDSDPAASPLDFEEDAVIIGDVQEASPANQTKDKPTTMAKESLDKPDTDNGAMNVETIPEVSNSFQLTGETALVVSDILEDTADTVESLFGKLGFLNMEEKGTEIAQNIREASHKAQYIGKVALKVGEFLDVCDELYTKYSSLFDQKIDNTVDNPTEAFDYGQVGNDDAGNGR